jgi:mxaJ protein
MSSGFERRAGRGVRGAGKGAWAIAMLLAAAVALSAVAPRAPRPEARTFRHPLRVCSDPNNLPFSNAKGEGFENRIAELVADDLGERLEYTWWAQRRGFVRNTLSAHACDVVMGTPAHVDMMLTTTPYYRSTYVFVSRRDRSLDLRSFDDPRLRKLRIGVPVIGDDYASTPPVHALVRRGLVSHIIGYPVYGDYAQPNPPARLVDAVARRTVDVAIAWGPLAGYVARHSRVPLTITPAEQPPDLRAVPFAYDIAMGVRKGDTALRARLDSVIVRRRAAIDGILDEFGVPRVAAAPVPRS